MTQDATIMRINPALALQKPLEDYIQYLEKMTVRSAALLRKLAVPGMNYIDPLHDVRGIDNIVEIFQKRFTSVQSPKYRVQDYAWARDGQTVYLRWIFSCVRDGAEVITHGMSEVMFSNDDLVMAHTDYVCALYEVPERLTWLESFRARVYDIVQARALRKRERRRTSRFQFRDRPDR